MAVGDPERVDEVVQLPDEQVDRPEVGAAVGVVGAAAVAELVVVDDGPAVGEIGEREEVVVGRAWTAVKNDERRGRGRVAGPQLARHAVPGLRVLAGEREGHGALARIHRRDSTPGGVVHIFHGFHSRLRPSGPTVESGPTLIPATRTRRRERALSEAEAYARCHGQRALSLVRMPVDPKRDERLRTALMRALEELGP